MAARTAGIDKIIRMKKLRHCHPMYRRNDITGEQQVHRFNFSALRRNRFFPTSLSFFPSIDYYTIYKYDKVSGICYESLRKFNHFLSGP